MSSLSWQAVGCHNLVLYLDACSDLPSCNCLTTAVFCEVDKGQIGVVVCGPSCRQLPTQDPAALQELAAAVPFVTTTLYMCLETMQASHLLYPPYQQKWDVPMSVHFCHTLKRSAVKIQWSPKKWRFLRPFLGQFLYNVTFMTLPSLTNWIIFFSTAHVQHYKNLQR